MKIPLKAKIKVHKNLLGYIAGAVVVIAIAILGARYFTQSHAAVQAVAGENYQICSEGSQYLTSPYTYNGLSSGSQNYTVAQYEALPGYGTTLPALPSYIAAESPSTQAAVIFAPGSNANVPQYNYPNTPLVYYFEGGNYGLLGLETVSGDEIIGGSTASFPEPVFDDGGNAGGISAQNDSYDSPSNNQIATLSAAAAQGATSLSISSSSVPLVPWGVIMIGGDDYTMSAVTGSQQSGYTVTIPGLDAAAAANTPVLYDGLAGDVTVDYLNIGNDQHDTTGTIYTGSGWTVEHDNVHDGYSSPGLGVAFYGGDEGTVEYNCFSKMGDYGMNIFGTNNTFNYNEVYESNYEPDPGCGCSGGGKWWGTLNANVVDNAFVNNGFGGGGAIWLDNGNTGTLIQGNYFDKTYGEAISSETGYNLDITGNLFEDDNWGSGSGCGDSNCAGDVTLNSSGGFNVPNSRYNNEVQITDNQFVNDWGGVGVWQSGARSCENSGEGWPQDAPYCSGGYPNSTNNNVAGQYFFSHIADNAYGGGNQTLTKSASSGATTILVSGSEATDDQVGFGEPASTTTSSTTNVSSLSGSTINAASTSGFPSSGQLRVGTSAAWSDAGGSYTGAILSYTGLTSTSFTGVSLVRGSGTLAGPIIEVQPYKVTGETCYTNDCNLTITPGLTSAESSGAEVSNAGTCQLFATSVATPTSPIAPDGISYFDGCQWGTKNVTVSGNYFEFDPSTIASSAPLTGGSTTTCNSSNNNNCGINFMSFQEAGEPPFSSMIGGNAMMSNSTLTGCPSWDSGCTTNPLANINALSNPPDAPANNGEAPENNISSKNTYVGPWQWDVYWYGSCDAVPQDSKTGKSMPSDACTDTFAQWQSDWQQDAGSTSTTTGSGSNTTGTPPVDPTNPTNLTAKASSSSAVNLSWTASTDSGGPGIAGYYILRNSVQTPIATVSASTTTYTDSGLKGNTTYTYQVEAFDTATPPDVSSPSNSASATTNSGLPTTPTGLATTSNTNSQVGLSWTASTDANGPGLAGYKILRSSAGSAYSQIGTSTTTSYTDSTVSANTSYSYEVEAYDTATPPNASAVSSALSVTTPSVPPPSTPSGLTITSNNPTSVGLSWTASTDTGGPGIAGYQILRASNNSTTYAKLGTVTGTTYTDSSASPGTTYSYEVEAYDKSNNTSSAAKISDTTPYSPPTTPSGLQITSDLYNSVALSWNASTDSGGPGLAGYHIYRDGLLLTTVNASTTIYTDNNVSPSTAYNYFIVAYDLATTPNISGASNFVSTTTPAAPVVLPTAPTNASVKASSTTSVTIGWTASTDTGGPGIAGYYVLRSTDGGEYTTLGQSTTTSYTDTTVTAGTGYSYEIEAFDTANNVSAASTPVTVTTAKNQVTIPTQPTGLSATVISSSQINLSWTASTATGGVTGYEVWRATGSTAAVEVTTVTGTSYGDASLAANTTYTYAIVAYNSAGNSAPSSYFTATTQQATTAEVILIGIVDNAKTGQPIAGAHVYTGAHASATGSESAYTNSAGHYAIAGMTPGKSITYNFSASSYRSAQYVWSLPAGLNGKIVKLKQ